MRILKAVLVTTVLVGITAGICYLAAVIDEDEDDKDFDF